MAWGCSSFLIVHFSSIWTSVKKQNAEMCQLRFICYVTRFTKIGLTKQYQILRKEQNKFRVKYGFSIDSLDQTGCFSAMLLCTSIKLSTLALLWF